MNRRFITSLLLCAVASGCAMFNSKPAPIERRGAVVAEGAGQLSFRAWSPGMVSAYDRDMGTLVSSTGVAANSVVTVDPTAGRITVTDANSSATQTIYTAVNKSHQYELWFIPQLEATTLPARPAAR